MLLFEWVIAARMKRVTLSQPLHHKPKPFKEPVLLESLKSVLGTRWIKTARPREPGRDTVLIHPDEEHEHRAHEYPALRNLLKKTAKTMGDFFPGHIAENPVLGNHDIHTSGRFIARPDTKGFARDPPHPIPLYGISPAAAVRNGDTINMYSILRVPRRQTAA